jgi:predicted nucleic acid-binding protein
MQGVYECFEQIEQGDALGVVSSAIWYEVFLNNYDEEKAERFSKLLSGRRVQEVAIDTRVGKLSGELRQYYIELHKHDGGGRLTSQDTFHLATAVHYKLDAFYTFDDGKKPNKEDGGKSRSLLSISGNVAGYRLTICMPPYTKLKLEI